MFSAAAEGCLTCVRYYVEGVGLPHDATSETSKYTALDFAQWASAQGGTDTQAAQRYLTSFAPDRRPRRSRRPLGTGACPSRFPNVVGRGAKQRDDPVSKWLPGAG
jgi:hypothetical protein